MSLITVLIAFLIWPFLDFFTTTNDIPKDSVKYVCSSPITDGMSSSRVLKLVFIVALGIFKIGTIPV